ncbi:MAG: hypothetical protein DRH93_19230 [Deltaproteobacteria bacterium]|nr:MAG: hypothetical protein DRH93_19230 [Deltaproteobacteria bacterium]
MRLSIQRQLAMIVFFLLVIMPLCAFGTDGQIKINTAPFVINKSGSYVLTNNLVVMDPDANAISIEVNDVTLDLNGHTIQGPNIGSGSGSGIHAMNRYSIKVWNGRVWGFQSHGIELYSDSADPSYKGAGHIVEGVQTANNGMVGIAIVGGNLSNCTVNNNGKNGILAANSTLVNCTANNNLHDGIVAYNSTLANCTADNNSDGGIDAYDSALTNCNATGNPYGIGPFDCTLVNCTANRNNLRGIGSLRSTLKNCTANYNQQDGIFDYGESILANCTANLNGGIGIYAQSNATLVNCTANGNGVGIRVTGSNVIECTANGNSGDGIHAIVKCRIEGNTIRGNGSYGLYLEDTGNYAIRNVTGDNPSGNYVNPVGNYAPSAGDNGNYSF